MEKFYKERYKNLTLEQLEAELESVKAHNESIREEYEANIKKSGATPEETRMLNKEERELVYMGSCAEKEIKALSELIEEAKAKLQMQ